MANPQPAPSTLRRRSTPATVGAIAGVGLMEGRRSFDWRLFLKFAAGWAITIVVACATSMAFMAQGVYR